MLLWNSLSDSRRLEFKSNYFITAEMFAQITHYNYLYP